MSVEIKEKNNSIVEEKKYPSFKSVNELTKKIAGDLFDEWKTLCGHSFTAGFVVESLRTNDEVYIELHKNRTIKDVSF